MSPSYLKHKLPYSSWWHCKPHNHTAHHIHDAQFLHGENYPEQKSPRSFYQQPFATGSEWYTRRADPVACHHDPNGILECDREGANWYTHGTKILGMPWNGMKLSSIVKGIHDRSHARRALVTGGLSEMAEAKYYGSVPVITPKGRANIDTRAYQRGPFGQLESE